MKLINCWLKLHRSLALAVAMTAIFCALFALETLVSANSTKTKPATQQTSAQKIVAAPSPKIASQTSPDYVVTVSTGASIVPGTDDAAIDCDDCTNNIALPFTVQFYDETFTSANVSSNGLLEFSSNNTACCGSCVPQSVVSDAIAPLWTDLITNAGANGEGATEGVFTSVSGTAPNRIFNIEWVTNFICDSSSTAHFEVRLYEGQSRIDFIYGTLDLAAACTSEALGIGVQRDTGSQFTEVSCAANRSSAALPASGTQYTLTIPTGCAEAPPGMVSWWPGDDNTKDIQDGNDGTFNGTSAYAAGEVGQAFSFDGSSYVSVPATSSLDLTQFSIDAWIYPTTSSGIRYVVDKELPGNNQSNYYIALEDGNAIEFGFNPGQYQSIDSTIAVPVNAWSHVAATYDGTTLKLYINGVLNVSTDAAGGFQTPLTGQPFAIGIRNIDFSDGFQGLIDEVEVFSRALAADEVQNIYLAGNFGKCRSCTTAPPGMIAWWRGDDNANDSVGGNNGTLLANATFAPGEVGDGFSFNGNGANVSVPSPIGNFGTGDFTIDFWMQTTSTAQREVINKRLCGDGNSDAFEVRIQNGGALFVELLRDNDGANSSIGSNRVYNDGQFHHIAIVRSGNTLSIYGDGTLDNSITDSNVGATDINNNFPLGIGGGGCSDPNHGDGTGTFLGVLDEIEIFNRALSDSEISRIFSAGSNGKCSCSPPPSNLIGWWPAEGDANDVVNNNNGTLQNGATFGTGEVSQAFKLDGIDDYVSVPDNATLHYTDFTYDAWIAPDADSPAGDNYIICKGHVNYYEPLILINGNAGAHIWRVFVDDKILNGPTVTYGYQHVAVTREGTTVKLYVDGVLQATDTVSTANSADGENLEFGNIPGFNSSFFKGRVDEVEIFSRALTAAEISNIYHAGSAGKCRSCITPPTGMVGWWPGDGNLADIQGGHDGTGGGGGPTFSAGEVGAAMDFDGANNYFTADNVPDPNQGFTFDCWLYWDGSDGNVDHTIVYRTNPNLSASYQLGVTDTGALYSNLGGAGSFNTNDGAVPPNQWAHVAETFDGTTATIYVNGQVQTSSSASRSQSTSTIWFGSYEGGGQFFFNGKLDEIELFDHSLSQQEIAAIYDAGTGGKCKPAVPPHRELANISTRVDVQTGDDVGIAGFIIHTDPSPTPAARVSPRGAPSGSKTVLIRGLGPSLPAGLGSERLADPVLDLYDSNNNPVAGGHNDNWGDASNAAAISATGLAPTNPNEAAILITLNGDTQYTAILRGSNGSTGIGLVEVYDADLLGNSHFGNISTRGFVGTGDNVMIGGFIARGDNASIAVVRAIGPSLSGAGVPNVLADPELDLYDINGNLIEHNDNWGDSPEATQINDIGMAPGNANESAILFVPAPGNFTAIVSGVGNTSGNALVEVYRFTQ